MSHYGKIAAVLFRVAGCCVTIYSLVALFYNIAYSIYISNEHTPRGFVAGNILSNIIYFPAGIVLYVLSKPLAKLITRGLRDQPLP